MRIGIFGGTFDPPHVAHETIAENAFAQAGLNRLIWVPTFEPLHKEKPHASFEHRCGMVRALIADRQHWELSEIEQTLPIPSYSLHSVRALKKQWGSIHNWFLIVGADSWAQFPTWYEPHNLLEEVSILVFPRNKIPVQKLPVGSFLLTMPELPLASKKLRQIFASNPKEAFEALPKMVAAYVREHALYSSQLNQNKIE